MKVHVLSILLQSLSKLVFPISKKLLTSLYVHMIQLCKPTIHLSGEHYQLNNIIIFLLKYFLPFSFYKVLLVLLLFPLFECSMTTL